MLMSLEGAAVRLQHLTTENTFLRERIVMVETTVQPLLEELSKYRAIRKLQSGAQS